MLSPKDLLSGPERPRLSADLPHELEAFASRHGLSIDEAREILTRTSGSREDADAAAERHKRPL
jgi:plasmid stability protein